MTFWFDKYTRYSIITKFCRILLKRLSFPSVNLCVYLEPYLFLNLNFFSLVARSFIEENLVRRFVLQFTYVSQCPVSNFLNTLSVFTCQKLEYLTVVTSSTLFLRFKQKLKTDHSPSHWNRRLRQRVKDTGSSESSTTLNPRH